MKILFFSHESKLYGASISLYLLVKYVFQKTDYYPVVFCPENGLLVDKLRDIGIEVHVVRIKNFKKYSKIAMMRFHKNLFDKTAYFIKLLRIFNKIRPDIIYVNTIVYSSPTLVGKLTGTPVIVHIRESESYFVGFIRKIRMFLMFRFTDLFIAVSNAAKKRLINSGGNNLNISIVYNGIDLSEFYQDNSARQAIRNKLGLNDEDILVGMVGQISPRKGMKEFIEAASIIMNGQQGNRIFFIIVGGIGDLEYYNFIRKYCTDLGLDERFFFVDFTENIKEYYFALDIFINASKDEPFARVNLEAMAMGLPVIATDVGGNPEAIADGEVGFIVEPGNISMMTEKINQLVENKELRVKMGDAAINKVREKFSIDECSRKVVSIIEQRLSR